MRIHTSTRLQPLTQNEKGVAAVEFALITPLLLLLFFGVVELSNLLIADSRLRNATASVADLITQKPNGSISATDLNTVNIAAAEVMRPLPVLTGGNPRLAVLMTSYRTEGVASVLWTRIVVGGGTTPQLSGALGLTNPACNDATGLPTSLIPTTSPWNSVLRVTGRYEWRPWFATIYSGNYILTSTNYNMPRYSIELVADSTLSPPC